jgi:tetraacyldisaccharide 4'-kinase
MRILLLPFSLFYWLGVAVRNWFFDIGILSSKKVSVPVISIGNISAGGVGKTPFVEMLVERLKIDRHIAVVSRGYHRKSSGTVVVSDGQGTVSSAENSGDEPIQLAQKYPDLLVIVDEDRVRGAQKAIELGANIILLDDGFQHRYLYRDLNIVLLTAEEIMNGDLLLPSGNRREPLTSLKRADMIAITRCADSKEYEHVCTVGWKRTSLPKGTPTMGLKTKLKAFKRVSSDESVEIEKVAHSTCIAFSGIGNPKSFEELMANAKVHILKYFIFPDHYWYKDTDIKTIIDSRKQTHADYIITTEKDAARLRERFSGFLEMEPVIGAEIQQEILSGDQQLNELLQRIC